MALKMYEGSSDLPKQWDFERPRGHKAANTYNCLNNLDYVWYLNGKQKQLIKKLVHICMINGKKTKSHTIVYKTFHCLAHHGNILKLLVNTIKNCHTHLWS